MESQEGPDAIKHKGHIASRVPESDVGGDERVRQAQQPPVPEGSHCILFPFKVSFVFPGLALWQMLMQQICVLFGVL